MEFSVVEFLEEKSVAAVPTNWLVDNNSKCFWPKSGPNFSRLVQSKTAPDRNWTKHSVRVLKQCQEYQSARKYAEEAEYTSDLSSPSAGEKSRKRRKPAKLRSPSPPTSASSESETGFDIADANPPAPITTELISAAQHCRLCYYNNNLLNNNAEYVQILSDTTTVQLGEILNIVTNLSLEFASFKKAVIKELAGIKEEIRTIAFSSSHAQVQPAVELIIDRPALPLMNDEQFYEFDDWLKEEDKYKTVRTEFGRIGGRDAGKLVRNILRRLCSDELAQKVTLTGRNSKIPFNKFKCYQLVIDASRSSQVTKSTTDEQLNHLITDWFRTAGTRLAQKNVVTAKQAKESSHRNEEDASANGNSAT